tara:strand:- start:1182 stop:1493 length:312 start_codon:yes stop_codon:yes gene_type:complete
MKTHKEAKATGKVVACTFRTKPAFQEDPNAEPKEFQFLLYNRAMAQHFAKANFLDIVEVHEQRTHEECLQAIHNHIEEKILSEENETERRRYEKISKNWESID